MKKSVVLAGAAALALSAGAAFGQGTIDLRIVEAVPAANVPLTAFATNTSASVDATGATEVSFTLWVQAQITGDTSATGLTTFDGTLSDDGSGSFNHAALLTYEVTPGLPNFPGATDTPDFSMRRGMLPDYRATIGNNNADPGNGQLLSGNWTFLPLSISATGAGGTTGYAYIYKFTWTSTDTSARTVVLNISALGGGYQASSGLVTTMNIDPGDYTITIIPAPGAVALMGLGGLVALRRRR